MGRQCRKSSRKQLCTFSEVGSGRKPLRLIHSNAIHGHKLSPCSQPKPMFPGYDDLYFGNHRSEPQTGTEIHFFQLFYQIWHILKTAVRLPLAAAIPPAVVENNTLDVPAKHRLPGEKISISKHIFECYAPPSASIKMQQNSNGITLIFIFFITSARKNPFSA